VPGPWIKQESSIEYQGRPGLIAFMHRLGVEQTLHPCRMRYLGKCYVARSPIGTMNGGIDSVLICVIMEASDEPRFGALEFK
jgi:hypothetical protein